MCMGKSLPGNRIAWKHFVTSGKEKKAAQKPLWGMISYDRSRYTLYLSREGGSTNVHVEGYDPGVFEGFHGPVIRCDLAPLKAVLDAVHGRVVAVKGYSAITKWDRQTGRPIMAVNEYLDHWRACGVPVENWG